MYVCVCVCLCVLDHPDDDVSMTDGRMVMRSSGAFPYGKLGLASFRSISVCRLLQRLLRIDYLIEHWAAVYKWTAFTVQYKGMPCISNIHSYRLLICQTISCELINNKLTIDTSKR